MTHPTVKLQVESFMAALSSFVNGGPADCDEFVEALFDELHNEDKLDEFHDFVDILIEVRMR